MFVIFIQIVRIVKVKLNSYNCIPISEEHQTCHLKVRITFNNMMMLMRSITRVKTLPTCGFLTKKLNTNTSTDAAVCSESNQKLKDSSNQGGSQHHKPPTDESVSYHSCSIRPCFIHSS